MRNPDPPHVVEIAFNASEGNFMSPKNKGQHAKFFSKRLVFGCLGIFGVFLLAMALFINFDTQAAANLTDQVLRPLIGDERIIALEKIFFNTSDALNQIKYTYTSAKPKSPFLAETSTLISPADSLTSASHLNLMPVATTASAPLAEEGQWHNIPLTLFPNQIVLADTFTRPDPSRSYAFVTLVQMDMSKLLLWSVAGTAEPGGKVGKPGPGVIPASIQHSGNLVAAFDGGFQYRDGQYGMIVGKTTYLPLKNDLATLVAHNDGRIEIIKYEGQDLGNDVAFVRQNCPMLIEDGVIGTENAANRKLWGRTTTLDIYTWRSAIGVTASGNLIFAAGNAVVPSTLARALKDAGAINAMQLDINPNWVRFNIFNDFSDGKYSSMPVMDGIKDGSSSYLHGYQKDFFYITKR